MDEALAVELDATDPFTCKPERDPSGQFMWFRHPWRYDVVCKFGRDSNGRLCKLWIRADEEQGRVILLTMDVATEREEILLRRLNA